MKGKTKFVVFHLVRTDLERQKQYFGVLTAAQFKWWQVAACSDLAFGFLFSLSTWEWSYFCAEGLAQVVCKSPSCFAGMLSESCDTVYGTANRS